jgi:hypothetical protein
MHPPGSERRITWTAIRLLVGSAAARCTSRVDLYDVVAPEHLSNVAQPPRTVSTGQRARLTTSDAIAQGRWEAAAANADRLTDITIRSAPESSATRRMPSAGNSNRTMNCTLQETAASGGTNSRKRPSSVASMSSPISSGMSVERCSNVNCASCCSAK